MKNLHDFSNGDVEEICITINGVSATFTKPKNYDPNFHSGIGSILCGLRKLETPFLHHNQNSGELYHESD